MSGAEIATLVISLVSIAVSVTMTILIYHWSKKDTSTDYKLKDNIIQDLMLLEGNLNSICIKSATSHLQKGLDLKKETEFIKNFLLSPTMTFILSYDDSEKDKLFYMNLFLIANNGDNIKSSADLAKNASDMLHNICRINLLDKLKKISSTECLKIITNNKEQVNWLLEIANEQVDRTNDKKRDIFLQQLKHIKSKGINDPYIELFLILENNDSVGEDKMQRILNLCVEQYGRLDVTDREILEKYKTYLTDFKFKED